MIGNWTLGVDLGQIYDYSALAVVERTVHVPDIPFAAPAFEDHHFVRYLKRWPKGTEYRQVVQGTGEIMRRADLLDSVLVLDGTGVGREVLQLFLQAFREGKLGKYWPVAYVITGGREVTAEVVPKRELVGKMQILLQGKRLKIADALPDGELLRHELEKFRVKASPTGQETYESAREGDHDDIVIAVALACWYRHAHTDPRHLGENTERLATPSSVA